VPDYQARNRIERRTTIMPKQKTHRGAAKRFSFTKSGKVKHKQMNANHQVHLMHNKRTRHLRADGVVDNATEARTIHKLVPYK
jgi:large subunit ribosomal protein L35